MATMTLERSKLIEAPVAPVWSVVADLDGYHEHAESLAETRVLRGVGEGARRHCVDNSGSSWEETCVIWEPERRYVVDVDIDTYPVKYRTLFRAFRGTWSVRPVGTATEVTLRFEGELRRVPGAAKLASVLAAKSEASLEAILASYEDAVLAHV